MHPTIGRIVLYTLTAADAEMIERRRITTGEIQDRIKEGEWPVGAQAHLGNPVKEGDAFPAIIVRVREGLTGMVNLRVLLDGTDEFWATSRHMCEGDSTTPGQWFWPPRA